MKTTATFDSAPCPTTTKILKARIAAMLLERLSLIKIKADILTRFFHWQKDETGVLQSFTLTEGMHRRFAWLTHLLQHFLSRVQYFSVFGKRVTLFTIICKINSMLGKTIVVLDIRFFAYTKYLVFCKNDAVEEIRIPHSTRSFCPSIVIILHFVPESPYGAPHHQVS